LLKVAGETAVTPKKSTKDNGGHRLGGQRSTVVDARQAEDLDALVAAIEGDGPMPKQPQLSAAERYSGNYDPKTSKQRQQLSK
jgi:hypothetical protein